jgi:hypothetical protein
VFTDQGKTSFHDQLRQCDTKLFARFLSPELIQQAATAHELPCGRGPLHLVNLVWLALLAALRPALDFAAVLGLVLKNLQDTGGSVAASLEDQQQRRQGAGQRPSKHDPRGQGSLSVSEEAFCQARAKVPGAFWMTLLMLLAERWQQQHEALIRWKAFRLLTLDGTTLTLSRWQALRDFFGTAGNGRGQCPPQARLTMLQLPGVRLPWKYELTPLSDHEMTVAGRLLEGLQRHDLVLMDRGFFSYGLFWQIQNQGACFATRLKARIRLRTLRALGTDDHLVEWEPSDWRKQWRKQGLPSTITLRRIDYQIQGFRPSAVLTNVVDPALISAREWVGLAVVDEAGRVLERAGLYHRRWEIETTYAELKVTQGLEGSLRSRTPAGIHFEVGGHLLLYALVRWLMVEAAERAGVSDPLRLSYAAALREVQEMRVPLLLSGAGRARRVLGPRLLTRLSSQQVPLRPGRHYVRLKQTKPKNKGKGRYQPSSTLATVAAPPPAENATATNHPPPHEKTSPQKNVA